MRTSLVLFSLVAACSSSSPAPQTTDADVTDDSASMDVDAMDMDMGTADDTGSTADTGGLADTGTTAAATIHVGSFYFKPKTVTVKVGQTVEFIWDGGTHTVTSGTSCTKDGKFDSGVHSTAKYKFTHTFTEAGTFGFFCDFMDHCTSRGQEGSVTVTP
ncbi:MAG: cupredoxin domain-containing protein [Polyangiales bacterium]